MKEYVIFIAFIAVIGGGFLYSFFYSKKAKFKRRLKQIPLKRIRDFGDGHVARFVGKVKAFDEVLHAPLSNRPCVYYEVLVEQQVQSGKTTTWKSVIEEKRGVPFGVEDNGDLALISSNAFKALIVSDKKFSSGTFNDPSVGLKNYLQQHGIDSETLFGFNRTFRYKEGVFENGERITVYGKGKWTKEEIATYNLSDNYYLDITATTQDPIYISDDPEMVRLPNVLPKSRVVGFR